MAIIFKDLIEEKKVRAILETFSQRLGYSISLFDNIDRSIIMSLNANALSELFHNTKFTPHEDCIKTYDELAKKLTDNSMPQYTYTESGLALGTIPITLEDNLAAILFVGPVLFEKPDIEKFKQEAKKHNFDEKKLLNCLENIPVIDKNTFQTSLNNLSNIAILLSDLAQTNKNLQKELNEKLKIQEELNSSLKKLENTNLGLKEALLHKNRFLANMTHEVRTPLNGILGLTQTLINEYFGKLNEKQAEYVYMIHNSGQYLFALLNDVIDVTKIDSGTMDFEPEEFNLHQFISEILAIMKTKFNEKAITVEYYIDPNVKTVIADKAKCKQIIIHLLSNALKFTPEGGKVSVNAAKADDHSVQISVDDTGIGIREENLKNIFGDFYQVKQEWNETLGGTGIGLALSKRLAEMHNSDINVQSAPGKGSTFWFNLPIA